MENEVARESELSFSSAADDRKATPARLAVRASVFEVLDALSAESGEALHQEIRRVEKIHHALFMSAGRGISETTPKALSYRERKNATGIGTLTQKEIGVLKLVAEGLSNKDVADELYVTEQTVKFHLAHIYQKLEVDNRTHASVEWHKYQNAHQNGTDSGSATEAKDEVRVLIPMGRKNLEGSASSRLASLRTAAALLIECERLIQQSE